MGWYRWALREETFPSKSLGTLVHRSHLYLSLLPFSAMSDAGKHVLVRGINVNVLVVPLHRVHLSSGLIEGKVLLGVRPALPIDGVAVILGNKLSGGQVWAVGSSSSVSGTADGPGAQPHVEDEDEGAFRVCNNTFCQSCLD